MRVATASAPGKAVLCGEYAVLAGSPAIALAVDRRARVRITETRQDFHSVTATGMVAGAAAFRIADDRSIEWRDGPADAVRFALLEAVWRAVASDSRCGLELVLDTRPFFDPAGGRKLGLGSSAALAVALVAALAAAGTGLDELYRTAAAAHRRFQHGRGSGVDIAAAVHGGAIAYRMEPPTVEQLDWPAGLCFELLWSGQPASTAERLARLGGVPRGASADMLGEAAAAVLGAWREGAAGAILERLRAYTEALHRFSGDHGLGVFEGGHQALVDEAQGRGLVYKPCGAGGGDVGIVLAESRAAALDFAALARSRGFEPLRAARDPRGVQRDFRPAP